MMFEKSRFNYIILWAKGIAVLSINGWCNKMKLTLEELHEFILKICEKLSAHDLHSQEHVDGLVEKIQNETADKNMPAPPAS